METFCSWLVCGLGFSLGVAVGWIVIMIATEVLQRAIGNRAHHKTIADFNAESLRALRRRNALTMGTNEILSLLVSAVEGVGQQKTNSNHEPGDG